MKFGATELTGVTELELECLTDQVTLVTELNEQILAFLWSCASEDSVQLNNPLRSNIFLVRKGEEMGWEGRSMYLMVASESSTVRSWNRLLSLLPSVPSANNRRPDRRHRCLLPRHGGSLDDSCRTRDSALDPRQRGEIQNTNGQRLQTKLKRICFNNTMGKRKYLGNSHGFGSSEVRVKEGSSDLRCHTTAIAACWLVPRRCIAKRRRNKLLPTTLASEHRHAPPRRILVLRARHDPKSRNFGAMPPLPLRVRQRRPGTSAQRDARALGA
jgi:hypothetical protein